MMAMRVAALVPSEAKPEAYVHSAFCTKTEKGLKVSVREKPSNETAQLQKIFVDILMNCV